MKKIFKITVLFYFLINSLNFSLSSENFFNEGLELYKKEKFEDARFMFERSIVFNPKHSNSYLYLAKIYNKQKNQKKESYMSFLGKYILQLIDMNWLKKP